MRFIRFLGFFGWEKSCASELWTSQVVSGNRSPWILFWPAMVGLSKASRPSLTMAYLSITLAATCVVLSLAFRLQLVVSKFVGTLRMCDFKVMFFFFADEPTRLPWLEIGGMGRSIQRCLEEPSKAQAPGFLDAVLFATDGKKHHIYTPKTNMEPEIDGF